MLSKIFGRYFTEIFFLIFSRKQVLAFHANHLPSLPFADLAQRVLKFKSDSHNGRVQENVYNH